MKGFRSGSSLPTPSNQSPWTPAELVGVVTILLDIGLGGVLSLFLQLGSCCVLNSPSLLLLAPHRVQPRFAHWLLLLLGGCYVKKGPLFTKLPLNPNRYGGG